MQSLLGVAIDKSNQAASLDAARFELEQMVSELMLQPGVMSEPFYFADPLLIRQKINEIERLMTEDSGSLVTQLSQIKTTHTICNGLYAREVFIPKGTLVVGKIHRRECFSVMSQGAKLTLSEDSVQLLKAPYASVSRPGLKRVGLALEDTVWTTIHATHETDISKIEAQLIAETFDDVTLTESNVIRVTTMEGKKCQ